MKVLYSLRDLLALQSNAFRCVECNKFWLDNQPFGIQADDKADPNCRHPKLVRTMVVQRREETPQSRYRRKKRRSMR